VVLPGGRCKTSRRIFLFLGRVLINPPCRLYPPKRTSPGDRGMSVLGHKRDFASRKTAVDSGFDLLTRDEARQIAANIANTASIVRRGKSASDG
jgi:hypothetical protein